MLVAKPDILPDSRLRETKGRVRHVSDLLGGQWWIPIFCANCGADGGFIPEESKSFAFYLCESCGEKWEPLAGTMKVPTEVFWETVKQEQLEKYGRELTGLEVAEALKDEHHVLSLLAKDRPK